MIGRDKKILFSLILLTFDIQHVFSITSVPDRNLCEALEKLSLSKKEMLYKCDRTNDVTGLEFPHTLQHEYIQTKIKHKAYRCEDTKIREKPFYLLVNTYIPFAMMGDRRSKMTAYDEGTKEEIICDVSYILDQRNKEYGRTMFA